MPATAFALAVVFLIIDLMCRRKPEQNLPGVRFRKTCADKNEKGKLWVWGGERSALYAENF